MSLKTLAIILSFSMLTGCITYQDDYFYPMSACCRAKAVPACANTCKTTYRYACPTCPPCDNYYPCLDTYCHIGP